MGFRALLPLRRFVRKRFIRRIDHISKGENCQESGEETNSELPEHSAQEPTKAVTITATTTTILLTAR